MKTLILCLIAFLAISVAQTQADVKVEKATVAFVKAQDVSVAPVADIVQPAVFYGTDQLIADYNSIQIEKEVSPPGQSERKELSQTDNTIKYQKKLTYDQAATIERRRWIRSVLTT